MLIGTLAGIHVHRQTCAYEQAYEDMHRIYISMCVNKGALVMPSDGPLAVSHPHEAWMAWVTCTWGVSETYYVTKQLSTLQATAPR